MLASLAILLTAIGAYSGAPWWSAAPCALILLTISFWQNGRVLNTIAASAPELTNAATIMSIGHATAAAYAAHALGVITHIAFPF